MERNIKIKLKRITPELVQELNESPERLRQYAKEQAIKFPTPEWLLKSNARKRKSTTNLDVDPKIKKARVYVLDLFGMREKDAYDTASFTSKNVSLTKRTVIESSSTSDDQLKTDNQSGSANDFNSIELKLSQLCALSKLTQSRTNQNPKSTGGDKPAKHECAAFQKYVRKFLQKWNVKMAELWHELIAKVKAESLEPKLSDSEAIEQCKKFDYNNFLAHFFLMVRMIDADEDPTSLNYRTIYNVLLNDMKHLNYYIRRLRQLHEIKEFEDHINEKDQSKVKMYVENNVDMELPPKFTYINDVIPPDGAVMNTEPPIGRDCADGCSKKSKCCPYDNSGEDARAEFAYDSGGKLRLEQGAPIFECNKACKCTEDCPNRVVQKGRKQPLCIFKTTDRGWGIRTEKPIAKGQFVSEYVGEIITREEGNRRATECSASGITYLFDLDYYPGDDLEFTVDAAKFGNYSRFFNHSCNPNLGVWPVWTDCLQPNLHKLCLFALRKIEKNEELTFDYCTNHDTTTDSDSDGDESDREDGFTCKCGADNCRGIIFV